MVVNIFPIILKRADFSHLPRPLYISIVYFMLDIRLNKKFKYVYFNSVMYIIAANLLFYVFLHLTNIRIQGSPLLYYLGLIPGWISKGYVWQYVTYMFVHVDFFHILFNMYMLFMFGSMIERAVGSKEFLLFYFVTGVLAGVLGSLFYNLTGHPNVLVYGASGAVYALMFLSSVMVPNGRVLLFFIFPIRLGVLILLFLVMEVLRAVLVSDGVSSIVHVGGMLIAWLYCLLRFKISPFKVWKNLFTRK